MPLPPKRIQATLTNRVQLNETFFQITLQLSEPVPHLAGQYINLRLGNEFRAYSLSSLPNPENTVELCIDSKPGGLGSNFARGAEIGTAVEALFPLGIFTLVEQNRPSIFVATGSGISPFKAMIIDLLKNRQSQDQVKLLWGMRLEKELFWEEMWAQLGREHVNFKYHFCLSRENEYNHQPNNPCRFYTRVTNPLKKMPLQGYQAYLCGSTEMIQNVTQMLLEGGVLSQDIHHEKFY